MIESETQEVASAPIDEDRARVEVPMSGNEGRQYPLTLVAEKSGDETRIFIRGPFNYRNIVGEERYARHLESLRPPRRMPLSRTQRILGSIGLLR